jgi:hypothetical protein
MIRTPALNELPISRVALHLPERQRIRATGTGLVSLINL